MLYVVCTFAMCNKNLVVCLFISNRFFLQYISPHAANAKFEWHERKYKAIRFLLNCKVFVHIFKDTILYNFKLFLISFFTYFVIF